MHLSAHWRSPLGPGPAPSPTSLAPRRRPGGLVEDLGHDVFDGEVAGEHPMRTSSFDEPPGLSPTPAAHGEREFPVSWPRRQVPPATSLRSGCVVPCRRRLHFDLSPDECGGWERMFAFLVHCHTTVLVHAPFPWGGYCLAPLRKLRVALGAPLAGHDVVYQHVTNPLRVLRRR